MSSDNNRARRYWKNQDQKEKDKYELWNARRAVAKFRNTGDPSGFPDLKVCLMRKNGHSSKPFASFSLDGFGVYYEQKLTQEEYTKFELAYKATTSDDSTIGP